LPDSALGTPDTAPALTSIYDYISGFNVSPGGAFAGEAVVVTTTPTQALSVNAGIGTAYRVAHEFNHGTNATFSIQFSVSEASQTGPDGHQYFAWGSDWFCALGTTSGGANPLCGPGFVAGFAFPLNSYISPWSNYAGGGTRYDVFKITNVGSGTSSASFPGFAGPNPAFASCTGVAGCSLTDANGMVYTRQGASNARGDVFIVQVK